MATLMQKDVLIELTANTLAAITLATINGKNKEDRENKKLMMITRNKLYETSCEDLDYDYYFCDNILLTSLLKFGKKRKRRP